MDPQDHGVMELRDRRRKGRSSDKGMNSLPGKKGCRAGAGQRIGKVWLVEMVGGPGDIAKATSNHPDTHLTLHLHCELSEERTVPSGLG